MADAFDGKWQVAESENFDDYMKVIGVGWAMRQAGNLAKPMLTISHDGNHFVFYSESPIAKFTVEFYLDVEFDEKTPDGRECKSTVHLGADGKMIHHQKGKVDSTFTRWVENDMLIVECEAKGVKAIRKYKRI